MITIFHGTDITNSRKYFLDEKQKYSDGLILDGEKITLTDLAQIFEGGGLFEEQKTLFIENIFNKKKNKTEFAVITDYIKKHESHNIFFWEGKELEKTSLSSFKEATIKVFKLPQSLFLFLDSIKPNNNKQLVTLFNQTIETTEVEMVFFMFVRQIRLLIAASDPSSDEIDELRRLAPWQKSKLQNQADLFSYDQLSNIYNKLFKLEISQKTGNLSSSLIASIDFLLIEI